MPRKLDHPLIPEFTSRIHSAMAAFGTEFEQAPLLAEFQDRGVSRASLYRWMTAAKASAPAIGPAAGRGASQNPGRVSKEQGTVSRKQGTVRQPAAKPSQNPAPAVPVSSQPPPVAVADVAACLPPLPTVSDATSMGLVPVVELLRDCIATAQELVKHARSPEGAVRNARLLMQASEYLRRSIETAAKLNETVAIQNEMQRFHRSILDEIAHESPELQERILTRLRRACDGVLIDG